MEGFSRTSVSYTSAKVTQQKETDNLAPRARPSDTRVTIYTINTPDRQSDFHCETQRVPPDGCVLM